MEFTNEVLHVTISFLSVLYLILYSFAQKLDRKIIVSAVFLPLIYIFTRGHFTDIYPYPFLDANNASLLQALLNTGGIVLLFILLEFVLLY